MGSISGTSTTQAIPDEDNTPFSNINQVLKERAKTHGDTTLISYPIHETDFADYTGGHLDRITRRAAHIYLKALLDVCPGLSFSGAGLAQLEGGTIQPRDVTVALVGISSLEYYVTFLALQRLGITTMFISPRLADQGHSHLLNQTGCRIAIASGSSYNTLERILTDSDLLTDSLALISMIDYGFVKSCLVDAEDVDNSIDLAFSDSGDDHEFIIHSGGTTGLPKPVPLKVSAWLLQAHRMVRRNPPANTLSTLPLFHSFGLVTLLRGLVGGTRISILNAARPVTAAIIQEGLVLTKSQALVTVPYTMKFLAEADGGLQQLGRLKEVINAGSAVPDELGDKVVAAGTNIFHFYGQTECGALMEPPKDRLLWNWVTPLPHAAPFLKFEPEGNGHQNLYHLFVLPGLKQKVFSDQPDGSYATKDLFQRHPKDPNLWKFVARKDDIIVLVNGEKADPIPLEEAVMANANVKVAVAFGAGRDSLGLIVIRSEQSSSLSHEQYLASIAHNIDLGNSRVPTYARVSRDLIIVKDAETQYPATDKSTVIRSLFLKLFEKDIKDIYSEKHELTYTGPKDELLTDSRIMDIVSNAVRNQLGPSLSSGDQIVNHTEEPVEFSNTTDFFDLGLDSLQASNIRSQLLREVDLCGGLLSINVVFDYPNVELLTQHLIRIRSGQLGKPSDRETENLAQAMLERYSHFDVTTPEINTPSSAGEQVLLTGATGQVGAHILSQLLRKDEILKVICLVRASDRDSGLFRVMRALQSARLDEYLPDEALQKLVVYPGDLGDPSGRFGLPNSVFEDLRSSVTSIIHNAWSVNFNMTLPSFESQSIRPTFQLIQLALSSSLLQKPKFTFVSSIATIIRGEFEPDERLDERRYGWDKVGEMGYGQSKWVAEGICTAAAEKTGLRTRVARLGQIVGDTRHGQWKAAEAYPTLTQSALTIGALPFIEPSSSGAVYDQCYWLPVDTAAAGVVDIALHDNMNETGSSIFHVTNSKAISWNKEYLPAVKRALHHYGINFEIMPQRQWLQQLADSDLEVERNPPKKLLAFFQNRYGNVNDRGEPALEMTRACVVAPILGKEETCGLGEQLITKFVTYWVEQCWDYNASAFPSEN
ncbi:putative NRPS-like protein biosynthetic cluster [Gnomoniopsis sp. IMI 355080]|nr:putative NRPS-like protein biosynthetic cluster [Gnomoniopsis sp. IMI 355080]